MKDIEQLIPFIREFLDNRGLKDVSIQLMVSGLPVSVVNETHSDIATKGASGNLMKRHESDKGELVLFSKQF